LRGGEFKGGMVCWRERVRRIIAIMKEGRKSKVRGEKGNEKEVKGYREGIY